MKPHLLTLENIGPFTGSCTINFDDLGDMFLICGETGSGKSTVFDALTYALYGKLPGVKSTLDLIRLRSDFCTEKQEAAVTLEFSVSGKACKVRRTVPKQTTTKSGKTTKNNSNVVLSFKKEDGSWEQDSDKATEINEKLGNMLSLTCDEFSRIVLLPQGEFAEFMRQKSNERRQSLAKLFPVTRYTRIMEKTKERADAYKQQLSRITEQLEMLQTRFNPEAWQEKSAAIAEKIETMKDNQRTMSAEVNNITRKEERLRELLKHTQNREERRAEQARLTAAAPDIDLLKQQLAHAEQAAAVEAFIKNKSNTERSFYIEQNALEECTRKCVELQKEKENYAAQAAGMDVLKKENQNRNMLIQNLEQAVQYEEKLKKKRTQLREYQNRATQIQQDIRTLENNAARSQAFLSEHPDNAEKIAALTEQRSSITQKRSNAESVLKQARQKQADCTESNRLAAEITGCTEEIDKTRELLDTQRITVSDFQKEKEQSEQLEKAAVLAACLEPGKPCPVCGSCSHPAPAVPGIHSTDIAKKIEAARQAEKTTADTLAQLEKQRSALQAQKGIYDTRIAENSQIPDPDTAQNDFEALQKSESAAGEQYQAAIELQKKRLEAIRQTEETARQKEPLETELAELKNCQTALEANIHMEENLLHTLRAGGNGAVGSTVSAQEQLQEEKTLYTLTEQRLSDWETKRAKTDTDCSSEKAKKEQLEKSVRTRQDEYETAKKRLQEALAGTVFSNEQEASAALLEPAKKTATANRIEQHKTELAHCTALLKQIETDIADSRNSLELPVPPAATAADLKNMQQDLKQQQETIYAHITEISEKIELTTGELQSLTDLHTQWEQLQTDMQRITADAEHTIRLSEMLCGGGSNTKKTTFDAWILGMYLEEVTARASSRLVRISDGRYTMHLLPDATGGKDRYKGLDIEIADAYTGKNRPCGTLSGGETFMASISLALALSDIVQEKAGGVQLDSLFIDEGFGTLSEDFRERALTILDEIRGTRMVGLVSHIEELRARIPGRLEIHKTTAGSTIRIVT